MLDGTRWGSTGTICRDGLTVWHCARLLILGSRARPFHGKTTAVLLLALYDTPASCCVPLLMAGIAAVRARPSALTYSCLCLGRLRGHLVVVRRTRQARLFTSMLSLIRCCARATPVLCLFELIASHERTSWEQDACATNLNTKP